MRLDERVVPDVRPADDLAGGRAPGWGAPGRRRGIAVAVVLAVLLSLVGGLRSADDLRRAAAVIAADEPMSASDKTVLADLWRVYKDTYLEEGTRRTVDVQRGAVTTSEGQGYTMLRAVWMDDRQTFAESWQWTKDNLQREDFRMARQFGQRPDGSYGVREDLGGSRSATGADVDIAFALLMAYSRWKDDDYLYDALPVIHSVWEKSVVEVDDRPVLVADDPERANSEKLLVNPSHFAPYAYRVFARVDAGHDWPALVDNSYALLQELDRRPLDAGGVGDLPPDWVHLDRRTGDLRAVSSAVTTHWGHEGLPLPWRLALDATWYGEQRAHRLLERHAPLGRTWTADHRLVGNPSRDDAPAGEQEAAPAVYGGAMGYFTVVEPALAREVYDDELLPLYDSDAGGLAGPLGYYDSNWVWFGMALHLDELPNLNVTEE